MKIKELVSICKDNGLSCEDFEYRDYLSRIYIPLGDTPDDGVLIIELPQRWGIYYHERAGFYLNGFFETEDELCEYFLNHYLKQYRRVWPEVVDWNFWSMQSFIDCRYRKTIKLQKSRDSSLFIFTVNYYTNCKKGSDQFYTVFDSVAKRQASLWEHGTHSDKANSKSMWTVYDGNGRRAREVETFESEAEACKFFYHYINDYFHVKRAFGDVFVVKTKRFFMVLFRRLMNLFRLDRR